jgi:digeranylgeranylglycerophospholipid reductase
VTQSYDVAVVGAGPAGSTAANVTAMSGLTTVMIERKRQVGIPVQCGELVPTPSEIRTLFPKSKRLRKLVDISKEFITNRTSKICLISPRGRRFEFPFQMNVVDRASYDKHLSTLALDAGAELRLASSVVRRTRTNRITIRSKGETYTLNASIVIGADGPSSVVSRSLGNIYQMPERDLSPALNYVMSGVNCNPDVVEMYFSTTIAPGGYCWIIPKGGNLANVGFGIRKHFVRPNASLTGYLHRFINHHPLASSLLSQGRIVSRVGAIIPVGGPVRRTNSSNAVLVGDAASHVMASNGGGIPPALCGGAIAGDTIVKHFQEGVPISNYTETWKKEIGTELESSLAVLRVADQVMISDLITEVCMRLAGVRFLEPLIRCKLPIPVDLASKTLVRILQQVF